MNWEALQAATDPFPDFCVRKVNRLMAEASGDPNVTAGMWCATAVEGGQWSYAKTIQGAITLAARAATKPARVR